MSRSAIFAWMLVPQLFLTLLSAAIVWGIVKLSTRFQPTASYSVGKTLFLMGNMIALPQLILGFTMLNTFGYNAYDTRILPIWAVVLIVILVSTLILGAFFVSTVRKAWMKGKK